MHRPKHLAVDALAITLRWRRQRRGLGDNRVQLRPVAEQLADEHRAQLHNYLKATGCRVGLLVNFGHHPLVEHERIVL